MKGIKQAVCSKCQRLFIYSKYAYSEKAEIVRTGEKVINKYAYCPHCGAMVGVEVVKEKK